MRAYEDYTHEDRAYEDYTQEEIERMRKLLFKEEWEELTVSELMTSLWEGVRGWENIPNYEIIDLYRCNFVKANQNKPKERQDNGNK